MARPPRLALRGDEVRLRQRSDADASSDLLAELLKVVVATRPGADAGLISRAYHVAARVHAGQMRKSGDPYVTHPVAVAAILAETSADDQTLCAALLHDTLDCPGYSLAALDEEFGASVAGLVTGATADSRAVMIKLADRLHNMRTAAPLPFTTRLSKSADSLEVLVPLAGSLGLHAIRAELEDLAVKTLASYGPDSAFLSRRLLTAAAALLPRAARSRWRDEWVGELSALPTRRQQAVFAARTLAGIPRLAATLRRSRRSDDTR